jgi:type IV pilus assembly protein PilX
MAPASVLQIGTARDRGIALIVGLVILAILSMIGVAAFSISTQEERMAGNSRDHVRAFEKAEAALRDCEDWVAANGTAVFTVAGNGGMYEAPPSGTLPKAAIVTWSAADSRQALPAGDSYQPPACIAEHFKALRSSGGTGLAVVTVDIAHVTAVGYGLNPATVVKLESYYAM